MNNYADVNHIGQAYIISPISYDLLKRLFDLGEKCEGHPILWDEYQVDNKEGLDLVIPPTLHRVAQLGLAFIWEYALTSHDSYFAYNFPTEDSPNNLIIYKSNSRRHGPKLSKKKRLETEKTSAANELLFKLGLQNGKN